MSTVCKVWMFVLHQVQIKAESEHLLRQHRLRYVSSKSSNGLDQAHSFELNCLPVDVVLRVALTDRSL